MEDIKISCQQNFFSIILFLLIVKVIEGVMEIKGNFLEKNLWRHINMPLVGPSSTTALCICSLINSVDLQPMSFSRQVYREPVQEPLHRTGETLRPSSVISTENWKPKDLVRVQGKLSKCSSTWHWIQRVAFFICFPFIPL